MTDPKPSSVACAESPLDNAVPERPVRVLLVSALPPPPGGIATWTQILCERGLPAPFEFEVVDTRVFRRSQFTPPQLRPAEMKRNLRILWRIRRSLASGRFSLMHLNCGLTLSGAPRNLLSALIARRAKVPYVAHLRGTFEVPPGSSLAARFYRRAWRLILGGAAHILALGQPSYRSILELDDFAHKTTPLFPNFVDFRSIPDRVPDTGPQEGLRVIFTGALTEEKGIHTVVEVARNLPNARFQLVGGSSDEASHAKLLRQIRERYLGDRVRVLGPFNNRKGVRMLAQNDVFLFPSKLKYAGFSNSVAEAMAAGLPVVASPVGAMPEMIDVPEGGFLAAPDDVAAYVRMLERLRDDPALRWRMGQHNREKALREYDYDVVVRQLGAIYAGITAEN